MAEDGSGGGQAAEEEQQQQRLAMPVQQGTQGNNDSSVDRSSSSSSDVKVVVRVRPLTLNMELQPGVHTCVEVDGHNVCTVRAPHETVSMPFNWVAGPATTQAEFFKVVGRPTVENCLSGFNSSIFAYGVTGAGKTYTMIGALPATAAAAAAGGAGSLLPADAGIIPRIFKYLWQRMPEVQAGMLANLGGSSSSSGQLVSAAEPRRSVDSSCGGAQAAAAAEQPSLKWLVRCSMLEIHKEDVYDLLLPGSGPLNIREDIRRGVYVEGLCERVVGNVSDALDVLRAGIANRQVAATETNAASSRSHCIFTCHVESRLELQAGMVNVRSSRLHLVDLAGSERLKSTSAWPSAAAASMTSSCDGGNNTTSMSACSGGGAGGVGGFGSAAASTGPAGSSGGGGGGGASSSSARLRETTSINSSLTVLGLVILRLTEQQPHIPYRNSKLTFLLQDSIGGNAKTVIVANISPSDACVQETLSTLGFAARARKIVNKAVVNEDHNDDVTLLRQKVKRLQQELSLARALAAKASAGLLRLSDASSGGSSGGGAGGSSSSASRVVATSPSAAGVAVAAAAAQQAAEEAAQRLLEQQEQLAGALQLLSELGDRNSELEQAVEFCRSERDALEQNCLEARQELAAMQVSLQQAVSENKKRHRWFKASKAQQQAQQQQQQQQQHERPPAAVERSSPSSSSSSKVQGPQGGSGWSLTSMFSKRDKARPASAPAAASKPHQAAQQQQQQLLAGQDSADCDQQQDTEQQQQQEQQEQQEGEQQQLAHILQLVSAQLCELAGSVSRGSCPQGQPPAPCWSAAAGHGGGGGAQAGAAPGAAAASSAAAEDWEAAAAGQQGAVQAAGLLELQELQRQHSNAPELQGIVTALRTLVARQQQQQHRQQQQQQHHEPPSRPLPPSELHRQLEQERELTAQLQGRIRQLQQELLLAAGPAVTSSAVPPAVTAASGSPAAAVKFGAGGGAAARLARLAPGMCVHHSADAACMRALAAAGEAEAAADAGQLQRPEGAPAGCTLQGEPVVVQVSIAAAEGSSKAVVDRAASGGAGTAELQQHEEQPQQPDAAAADSALIAEQQQLIASLQAQVSELQQAVDVSQRERTSFYSRLQSARTVIAAARCSTPSSMLSSTSGLPSPQPSFGVLEPVFGSSIDEEPEGSNEAGEDEEAGNGLQQQQEPPPAEEADSSPGRLLCSSLSNWHPQPEPAFSPCRAPRQPSRTSSCAEGTARGSQTLGQLIDDASEELSQSMVWQQQYSQVRQGQQQYEHREQLAKAVHAAIAAGTRLGYKPWESVEMLKQLQQSGLRPLPTPPQPPQQQQPQQQHQPPPPVTQQQQQQSNQSLAAAAAAVQDANRETACSSSSDSETTRSNGSTRGSSVVSCSAVEPEAAAAVAPGAQAGAEPGSAGQQQQEEQSMLPAWSVADYEEEVRQLSDQLQGLLAQNSSYKASLQQRDAELSAQQELLEQQGHDLACCQDMLQELQERLAASEAAAAASAAEHCDAMWAKGQVAGLLELNELLQGQLEDQGQEVEELKEALQHLRRREQQGSEADQQPAAAAPAAAAVGASLVPGPSSADVGLTAVAAATAAACVVDAVTAASDAVPESVDVSTQTADAGSSSGGDGCTAKAAIVASAVTSAAAAAVDAGDVAVPHEAGCDQQCKSPSAHRAAVAAQQQAQQVLSPFKQLRLQTHQLRAEPLNPQVASEQAALLRRQLAAVGLHMQKQQLEDQLCAVKAQLQQLQQQQEEEGADACDGDAATAARGVVPSKAADLPHLEQQVAAATSPACADDDDAEEQEGVVDTSSASSSCSGSSGASTPRSGSSDSSSGSSSGDSCVEMLDELIGALHMLAAESHQASAFKAVSASTLSPLRRSLQQPQLCSSAADVSERPAGAAVPAGSRCVSSGSSPCRTAEAAAGSPQRGAPAVADAAAVDADAALKLQANLQVSSAYELAATRGLLHAGAVMQELKCALAGSTRQGQHQSTRDAAHRQRQCSSASTPHGLQPQSPPPPQQQQLSHSEQQQPQSPPVVRTLFSNGLDAVEQQQQQQQQDFSFLRQLHQQQQYIIHVLGSLSTATVQQQQECPAVLPSQLQQLADAQQQLQVLLHAASAALQHLHSSSQEGDSLTRSAADQALAAASRQGSGCWAAAGPDASDSPSRQGRKQAQQLRLQGSSPDQQQPRDSSPNKLQQQQIDGQQQELTQLRGRVIRLQLELQRVKQQPQPPQQAHAADSLASTPDRSWARQSQDSQSQQGTPGGAAAAASPGGSVAAGTSAGFGTPGQVLLLSGRNRQLQSQCLQRDCQIRQLEAEVRRLQLEANISKQQALTAAAMAGGGGGVGSGALTPRNPALTPRHGLAAGLAASSGHTLYSPQRRAVSSPGGAAVVAAAAAAGTPRPHAAAAASPAGSLATTHWAPQQLPATTRFASGSGGQAVEPHAYTHQYGLSTAGTAAADGGSSCTSSSCSSSISRGGGHHVQQGKPPLHQQPHGAIISVKRAEA